MMKTVTVGGLLEKRKKIYAKTFIRHNNRSTSISVLHNMIYYSTELVVSRIADCDSNHGVDNFLWHLLS